MRGALAQIGEANGFEVDVLDRALLEEAGSDGEDRAAARLLLKLGHGGAVRLCILPQPRANLA